MVKSFSNNKPWSTKKKYLNEKNTTFCENDFEGFKIKIKELSYDTKAKIDLKSKVEDQPIMMQGVLGKG